MSVSLRSLITVTRYALADLRAEPIITGLTVMLFGLTVAPLLMLHVVKTGVIAAWSQDLARDTGNREIQIAGEYRITRDQLAALAAHPLVGFVVPEASFAVSEFKGRLITPRRGHPVDLKMRTTAPGDPAFPPDAALPHGSDQIALTNAAARALAGDDGVAPKPGDRIELLIRRTTDSGKIEMVRPALTITTIAPDDRWTGGGVFVAPELARAIEAFRWFEVPADKTWPASVPKRDAPWKSLRIYARTIREAPALSAYLDAQGFDTEINTSEITNMLALERGLTRIFLVIVALSAIAFTVTAFLTEWVGVNRKRSELAVMLLAGFQRRQIWLFPVVQALAVTVGGAVLALGALAAASPLIADFVSSYSREGAFILPPWWHLLMGLAAAALLAVVSCWGAVRQIADLDISSALRSD